MIPVFVARSASGYGAALYAMGIASNVEIRWLLLVVVVAGLTVSATRSART